MARRMSTVATEATNVLYKRPDLLLLITEFDSKKLFKSANVSIVFNRAKKQEAHTHSRGIMQHHSCSLLLQLSSLFLGM